MAQVQSSRIFNNKNGLLCPLVFIFSDLSVFNLNSYIIKNYSGLYLELKLNSTAKNLQKMINFRKIVSHFSGVMIGSVSSTDFLKTVYSLFERFI